jgi:hypothetical protein
MNDAIAAFTQSLNIYEWYPLFPSMPLSKMRLVLILNQHGRHIEAKQLTKLGIPVDAHGRNYKHTEKNSQII